MNLKRFNAVALAIFVLTSIFTLAGMCTAVSVEIRGTPLDSGSTDSQDISWDFRTSDAGKGSNGGYVIYPAKTVILAEQSPAAAGSGTAGTDTSSGASGNVQMQEESST